MELNKDFLQITAIKDLTHYQIEETLKRKKKVAVENEKSGTGIIFLLFFQAEIFLTDLMRILKFLEYITLYGFKL